MLFAACALNELFFVSLYMIAAAAPPPLILFNSVAASPIGPWHLLAALSAPVFLFKQAMNVIQLSSAALSLAELDAVALVPVPVHAKNA